MFSGGNFWRNFADDGETRDLHINVMIWCLPCSPLRMSTMIYAGGVDVLDWKSQLCCELNLQFPLD